MRIHTICLTFAISDESSVDDDVQIPWKIAEENIIDWPAFDLKQ